MPRVRVNPPEDPEDELLSNPITDFFSPGRGRSGETPSPINLVEERSWDRPWGLIREPPEQHHESRSERAQTADESFNAPVAPDYATWRANPNRYDFPMVDTIPPERIQQRADDYASEALEAGAVTAIRTGKTSKKGEFHKRRRHVKLDTALENTDERAPSESRGFILAHEVAHGVDFVKGETATDTQGEKHRKFASEGALANQITWARSLADDPSEDADGPDPDLVDELRSASVRARGEFDDTDTYRGSLREITADALALRRVEPRAFRREFPTAEPFLGNLERSALEASD